MWVVAEFAAGGEEARDGVEEGVGGGGFGEEGGEVDVGGVG